MVKSPSTAVKEKKRFRPHRLVALNTPTQADTLAGRRKVKEDVGM